MKRTMTAILMSILVCLLTACPGLQDWWLELPNNYKLSHVNVRDIEVVYGLEGESWATIVIDGHVIAYCADERYLGVQQISQEDYDAFTEDKEVDISYYLLDTEEDEVWGPLSLEEYQELIVKQKLDSLGNWVPTFPPPDDAQFPSFP